MSMRAHLRNPVAKHRFEVVAATAGTHILTSAWLEVITAMGAAADAFEVLNTTGRVLMLATGASGSELAIPYYVMPSAEPHLVPWNIAKGTRISAKAVDADADETSQLVFNFFG